MDSNVNQISPFLLSKAREIPHTCTEASMYIEMERTRVGENSIIPIPSVRHPLQYSSPFVFPSQNQPRYNLSVNLATSQEKALSRVTEFDESQRYHKSPSYTSSTRGLYHRAVSDKDEEPLRGNRLFSFPDEYHGGDARKQDEMVLQFAGSNIPWSAGNTLGDPSSSNRGSHSCHVLQVRKQFSLLIIAHRLTNFQRLQIYARGFSKLKCTQQNDIKI